MATGTTAALMTTPDMYQIKTKSKKENMNVFLRVRPLNTFEKGKAALPVVDCPGPREVVVRPTANNGATKTFTFDRVFGPMSKQIDVYKAVVAPLLDQVMEGYSCTVFAYGQTGTGKTFTMEGERTQGQKGGSWETDPLAGIVPRAMSQLFEVLRLQESEFTVRVSLLELYNEEVYDLLSPLEADGKPKTVRLYEDTKSKGSVFIKDLEEVIVHSKHDVYGIMERGSQMRKTASTLLNANSSRSHTVFTVTVHIKESNKCGDDLLKIGRLYLVDLAGSENIGRSGAVDKHAREAGNINQSLLTLGRVITALVECQPHVPYRESKLTRLLQDSLGGRTKTSIIATVSPASINIEETLSTLDYAHRAKNIKNRPEVNQKLTKQAMLKEYTEEIERLRRDLLAAREKNGIFLDKASYDQMMCQLQSQSQDLTDNIQQRMDMEQRLQQKDTQISSLEAVLEETRGELEVANCLIHQYRVDMDNLKHKVKRLSMAKEEAEHLVEVHSNTETKLKHEATTLLETAKESTADLERVYDTLDRKKMVERSNFEAGARFRVDLDDNIRSLGSQIDEFREQHSQFAGVQRLQCSEEFAEKDAWYSKVTNTLQEQNAQIQAQVQAHLNQIMAAYEQNTCEIVKQLSDARERDEQITENRRGDMSNHCESVSSIAEDFKKQVYQQSGKLNEFWDSTYLLDNPSGATPGRKGYEYPMLLSATSPHGRILERYRANHPRPSFRLIPIDFDDEDDVEEENVSKNGSAGNNKENVKGSSLGQKMKDRECSSVPASQVSMNSSASSLVSSIVAPHPLSQMNRSN